jgi:CheY-specific phosphatase CheX
MASSVEEEAIEYARLINLLAFGGSNSSVDAVQRDALGVNPKATNWPALKSGNFHPSGLTFIIFIIGDTCTDWVITQFN